MSEALLELRDVTRHFEISQGAFHHSATLTAVANVSLQVKRGEVYALVGESGSGKSTLAKMLLGLLPPSSGEILIDGVPLADSDRVAIARRVQPIFQDPYSSLNPRKSIAQLIALPLMVHDVGDSASRRAKVTEMLDMVGLSQHLFDAYPNQLSGGQRQRVAIARALVMRPEVVSRHLRSMSPFRRRSSISCWISSANWGSPISSLATISLWWSISPTGWR
jgi:peptide/nickel transport system ATP-binding protein